MGSEAPSLLVEKGNVSTNAAVGRSCSGKENWVRPPKRAHKSEREKLKREHLNELFLKLENSLEPTQHNNGKASVLCEATRILKDLISQIEGLRKENAALLSESHYVSIEKNELREEKSALETVVQNLQNELKARMSHSKPDLNIPPPKLYQPEISSHFPGDCLSLPPIDPALPQPPTVFMVPLHPDMQSYQVPEPAQLLSKPPSNVSKPHARYPTPADSWPAQLLGKQPTAMSEHSAQNNTRCNSQDQDPDGDIIHTME